MATGKTPPDPGDDTSGASRSRGAAPEAREGADAPIEFNRQLGMVVEVIGDVAAAQASEATAIRVLMGVANDLLTAYDTLQASLEELHARVDAPGGDAAETVAAQRRAEITGQVVRNRLALRDQAHQLQHHASKLNRRADQLRTRAASLTERAAELVRDAGHTVGDTAGGTTQAKPPTPPGSRERRLGDDQAAPP